MSAMADPLHVGITGTRHPLTSLHCAALRGVLTGITAMARDRPLVLHHGVCVGADEAAHKIARTLGGWSIEGHPGHDANGESPWRAVHLEADCGVIHPALPYGARNEDITIISGILVAAPAYPEADRRSYRSGTWQTIRLGRVRVEMPQARLARIVLVWPDGTVSVDTKS